MVYAVAYPWAQFFDLDRTIGHAEIVFLDSLLKDYRLLVAGCGQGGYVPILENYREIIGIEPTGERLVGAIRGPGIFYRRSDFMDFDDGKFDAISLCGTYGLRETWTGRDMVLAKAALMLNEGGILITSHIPPRTFAHHMKDRYADDLTIVIRDDRFRAMTDKAGFTELIRFVRNDTAISFHRLAPPHAP